VVFKFFQRRDLQNFFCFVFYIYEEFYAKILDMDLRGNFTFFGSYSLPEFNFINKFLVFEFSCTASIFPACGFAMFLVFCIT